MYYKVLNQGGACIYANGYWHLPKRGPGEWMPVVKDLEMCESGYHLCRRKDLVGWLGPEIYEAEGRGKKLVGDDEVVFQQARLIRKLDTWNDRTARLFTCDCAERIVHLVGDERSVEAIKVARRYANGEATDKERAVAQDAARAARVARAARAVAQDAVWEAAWEAERKWQTKRLFEYLDGKR